jgi:hypothetical protein
MPSRYALASAGDYTPDDSKAWAKHKNIDPGGCATKSSFDDSMPK